MSTLTEAAIFSKKASVWAVIGIAALIFLFIFLGIFGKVKNALFPAPPAPPTVAFGKLPRVDLKEGIGARTSTVYNLETISGDLPILTDDAKVFAVGDPAISFGTLEAIKSKLAAEGFNQEPIEVSPSVLKFTHDEDSRRTITVNLAKGDFLLSSDYFSDSEILSGRPDSVDEAIERARGFFQSLGVDFSDFKPESITTKFIRIDGTELTQATSLSGANLIQVIFNRSDLDTIPTIWSQEDEPQFYALVSSGLVVEAKVQTLAVEKFKFATYPLRGSARAFEDLKGGNAAFNKPVTTSEVAIINVSIGYVESGNEQFLQPFYFFHSIGDLIAYVPAVDQKWVD